MGEDAVASRSQQSRRLEALARYGVLDTPREPEFDDLAALAAEVTGYPIAAITFVDAEREWVKAAAGAELPQVASGHSLGAVAIAAGSALTVGDVRADPRLEGCDWASAPPHVRAYAARTLTTPGGLPLGTLCVLDPSPRPEGPAPPGLERVARLVTAQLERKREAALAQSLVAVVAFDGRFLRVSEACETLLGYKPAEMVGHRAREFIHPDDLDRSRARMADAVAGADGVGFENRYRHKDGSYRWLLWSGHAVPEEQLFYADAKDITERKSRELGMLEREERYRLLAENATDMISSHTLDGTITYVSKACETLLGYRPDELIGEGGYELIHPDDLETVRSTHEQVLAEGGRGRATCRMIRKDGSAVWVELMGRLVQGADGELVLQVATRDVSEARAALEALQQAEERFRKAFDEAPIGMTIVGLDDRLERVNDALCALLGYRRDELLGRRRDEISHPDDVASTAQALEPLFDGRARSAALEKRYLHRNGHEVWTQASMAVLHDGEGRRVGLLGHAEDISARRRAEAESAAAREAAERANQAKSEFLTRMSHELRTPLNAVLGFAQLLELEELSPSQGESVARILAGGRHLHRLIDDVLDISRIEAGQLPISLAPVSLRLAVSAVVELLTPLADERSIGLEVDLGAVRELEALGDRQRFEQVLLNLVSNAIKYGPQRSRVRLRGELRGARVRVAVIDEGPGIASEDRERLFEPFERLGAADAGIEGIGLGLALSRNLTEAMGGAIGVESEGIGSSFWVELPLMADRESGDAEEQGPAPGSRFPSRQSAAVETSRERVSHRDG